MALFKCIICGCSLEISSETVTVCQKCATRQILPQFGDDHRIDLYGRADHFCWNNEIDKVVATAPLLKRVFLFLEDGDWNSANKYCEKVLDQDPENPLAYIGKLMAELQVRKQEALKDCAQPFENKNNYQNALRFADEKLKITLTGYVEHIYKRNELARLDGIYEDAIAIMSRNTLSEYKRADDMFNTISGWKNADELAQQCKAQIQKLEQEELEYHRIMEEEERKVHVRKAKQIKIITITAAFVVCVAVTFVFLLNMVIIPNGQYDDAFQLQKSGEYGKAAIAFGKAGDFSDAKAQSFALWTQVAKRDTISTGEAYTVGLKADGTVVAVGSNEYGQCDVSAWADIVAISAGQAHTVGLKADGTVVAVGSNRYGQCDVSDWRDIVAVSASFFNTVGLKNDGTVVTVGDHDNGRCEVSDWTDIVAISSDSHIVGLKTDGTVVAVGDNTYGQCNVSDWTDIVAISADSFRTVGLKADGTVVTVGHDCFGLGLFDVSDWTDIVAISADDIHIVGLKADGTVVRVGFYENGRYDVSDWTDIVAISAGDEHIVGLKADGTVVAIGSRGWGRCNVGEWHNIKID